MDSVASAKAAILDRVSIYDVIGTVVELSSKSGLKVGRCPFHDEKTASFSVYPDHYYCFGCKEHGDIITFVRKTQGLGFIEALKYLAPKAGLNPEDLDTRRDKQERSQHAALYKALVAAQQYFTANLEQPASSKTIEYLRQRGFDDDNIKAFGFGRSFDQPRGLLDFLGRQGFSDQHLESCSLASRSQKNNRCYDFFRDRLTVPIHDQFGRLIGFGGRALSDEQMPKYKNSRENKLFDKSVTLYGFHRAKDYIRKGEPAIICEGYMDVLQLWQNELHGAVACMGTAIKQAHLKKLSNLTNRVYLVLDGDRAGQQGSLATISAALDVGKLDVMVARLPDGEDPDSFVRANGPDAVRDLLNQAVPILDFGIRLKLQTAGDTSVPDILRQEILPWLMRESDHLKQAYLVNRVAQITGISRKFLEDELEHLTLNQKHRRMNQPVTKEVQDQIRQGAVKPEPTKPKQPLGKLDYELIGHLFFGEPTEIDIPKVRTWVKEKMALEDIWVDLIEEFLASHERGASPAEVDRSLWTTTTDPVALALMQQLDRQNEAFKVDDRAEKISRLLDHFEIRSLKNSLSKLKQKMAIAQGDEQISLLQAIQSINKNIKQLSSGKSL